MATVVYTVLTVSLAFYSAIGAAINPRRVLRPKDNVGEMIKQSRHHMAGRGRDIGINNRYTIHTEIGSGFESTGLELAIDVLEALDPAVTPETVIIDERVNAFTVSESGTLLYTLLVSDSDTADGAETFAMLALNPETDDMRGFVEKRGADGHRNPYKIQQKKNEYNGIAMAEEQVTLTPPEWHCDVIEDVPIEEQESMRRLVVDDNDHQHKHHHTHEHHDENLSTMESLTRSVRGIKANPLNKSRQLQSSYHYQVEMYIEIDNAFISNLGGMENAMNYVNTLVTGANVIFEKEIDTHLRVTTIQITSLYDDAKSTSDALNIMRSKYGGDEWHSSNVDIHHALLGGIGGGIAYIGVLCRSDWGFGLTGGFKGNFESIDEPVVWDVKSFMHEASESDKVSNVGFSYVLPLTHIGHPLQIGHNFGSGHTHDKKYYNPIIDGCGISCPSSAGYGWSTIMSYCQWCPGSYKNIHYTLGAEYDGSGDANDISNWQVNPILVANYDNDHKSIEPNRVPQRMYMHVMSKAPCGCLALSSPHMPLAIPLSDSGMAVYDGSLNVPKCSVLSSFCDSGMLLLSRYSIQGKSEPNGYNTLDSCTDGTAGFFHSDESVDSIKVISGGGEDMKVGENIKVIAKVWVYSTSADFIDFFYANDATKPVWNLIETVQPVSTGSNTLFTHYTLSDGSLQAVRVVIRYNGKASSCPKGSYDDADDLVFLVKSSANGAVTNDAQSTEKPTQFPTRKPSRIPTRHPTRLPMPKPFIMFKKAAKPTPMPTPAPKSGK